MWDRLNVVAAPGNEILGTHSAGAVPADWTPYKPCAGPWNWTVCCACGRLHDAAYGNCTVG